MAKSHDIEKLEQLRAAHEAERDEHEPGSTLGTVHMAAAAAYDNAIRIVKGER